MQRRSDVYLSDILTALDTLDRAVAGCSKEQLAQDDVKLAAVLRCLTVIGVAVARLPAEFRNRHPVVPWRRIKGLRDVVVHKYDRIDIDEIMGIIKEELGPLRLQAESRLLDLAKAS